MTLQPLVYSSKISIKPLVISFLHYGIFQGIWYGMLSGTLLQTMILVLMTSRTKWTKEASAARDRVKKWGGEEV
ncbi:unnamed protein product [Spirodela intermedia]|uniref:Uncharacterized protein n=1 Tax=Spirodela intermedia TaxID=51605 RepID=A0A7I8JCV1_SPIIN|nr:unnamed protein product [Spirodela intermedia]CAA6667984.1 unnamed protein product [Spirodela intermedia]